MTTTDPRAIADLAVPTNARTARTDESVLVAHRPVFKRLLPVLHVSIFPTLWMVTSCKCGDRWPCNDMKLFVRHRFGWTRDFNESLKTVAQELPEPETRWDRFKRWLNRHRPQHDDEGANGDDQPHPPPRHRTRDCPG